MSPQCPLHGKHTMSRVPRPAAAEERGLLDFFAQRLRSTKNARLHGNCGAPSTRCMGRRQTPTLIVIIDAFFADEMHCFLRECGRCAFVCIPVRLLYRCSLQPPLSCVLRVYHPLTVVDAMVAVRAHALPDTPCISHTMPRLSCSR